MKTKMTDYFVNVLKLSEKNSTCARIKVAALLVKDSRIISTGWNGVPSKFTHCNEIFVDTVDLNQHKEFSDKYELHAEQNCLAFAARKGIKTEGTDIYVSVSPCNQCAKLIIASGIKNVFYLRKYDREDFGLELLEQSSVKVYQL